MTTVVTAVTTLCDEANCADLPFFDIGREASRWSRNRLGRRESERRGLLAQPTAQPGIRAGASSSQPLPQGVVQRRRGLLIQAQHATVRQMRIEHDDPTFPGHEKVGEPSCTVRLAGGHDHATLTGVRTALVMP